VSGPFAPRDEAREISEVNVVPLADVSLVLLIILLVLSPALRESMLQVRSAAASASPAAPAVETLPALPPELVLVVGLAADGYFLGAARFAREEELAQALRAQLRQRSDKKVFLAPYGDATVEAVVRALELITASGAQSVALVQTQEDR
jgi:biopolymer transport protein ExbD